MWGCKHERGDEVVEYIKGRHRSLCLWFFYFGFVIGILVCGKGVFLVECVSDLLDLVFIIFIAPYIFHISLFNNCKLP